MNIMTVLCNIALGENGLDDLKRVTGIPLHEITANTSLFCVVDKLIRYNKRVSAIFIVYRALDCIIPIKEIKTTIKSL